MQSEADIDMDIDYWESKIYRNIRRTEAESDGFEDYDKEYYKEVRFESNKEEWVIDEVFTRQA